MRLILMLIALPALAAACAARRPNSDVVLEGGCLSRFQLAAWEGKNRCLNAQVDRECQQHVSAGNIAMFETCYDLIAQECERIAHDYFTETVYVPCRQGR